MFECSCPLFIAMLPIVHRLRLLTSACEVYMMPDRNVARRLWSMACPVDVTVSGLLSFLIILCPDGRSDFIINFSQFSERDVMRVSGNRYTSSRASVDSDLLFDVHVCRILTRFSITFAHFGAVAVGFFSARFRGIFP